MQTASGALKLPGCCGDVPAKSTVAQFRARSHPDPDLDGAAVVHFVAQLAVTEAADDFAHAGFGVVLDVFHVARDRVEARAPDERPELGGAARVGGELCLEVGDVLVGVPRRPRPAGEAFAQRRFADRAVVHQQEVVEHDAFLFDGVRGGRHRARRDAADVGVVRARGDEERRFPALAEEDGAHDRDVRQVRPAGVWRVQHPGPPGTQLARIRRDDGAHARAHRAEVDRHVRGIRDERARAVEEGAGKIETLADVDRDGRGLQHGAHLLRDLHEPVVEQLELRGIGASRVDCGHLPRLVSREPERAVSQGRGGPAGLDDRRGVGLDDEGRAPERCA